MFRRNFLVAAGSAGVSAQTNRIRLGIIGAGGRGRYLTSQFKEHGAMVTAVCDVYEPNLQRGLRLASAGASGHVDYRRLLEDKSIDAVVIATPDHLHASMLIAAVEAGKDVYIEKPLARTIEEGFRMVEAVRRTKRIVQLGTQRRSYELYQEAKRLIDTGAIGNVRLVTAHWLNRWETLQNTPLQGKLDWDLFLGPAPKRPVDAVRYFNWLQFYDYSGGLLIGQAAHIVDGIHWMMNSTYPLAVTCGAGRANLAGGEIPETSSMIVEYPENYLLVFTLGYQAMRYNQFNDQMQQFHGSKARFDLGRESWAVYPQSTAVDMKPSRERRAPGTFESASRAHVVSFLECVRTRREPVATVEMGQSTNVVLGMAVSSLRSGRRVTWDAAARQMR
ncbi:MAG: Gfo/Idh/MocA family oxidoreductase [Acidobacteria bacterium]|nr:Gfo/Idh/MocA family oxidoreductase [Acidobacteriota bacterium]